MSIDKTNLKKLDLKDRFEIEMGIIQGYSFKHIAKKLDRHPISVSREVRSNRYYIPANYL